MLALIVSGRSGDDGRSGDGIGSSGGDDAAAAAAADESGAGGRGDAEGDDAADDDDAMPPPPDVSDGRRRWIDVRLGRRDVEDPPPTGLGGGLEDMVCAKAVRWGGGMDGCVDGAAGRD